MPAKRTSVLSSFWIISVLLFINGCNSADSFNIEYTDTKIPPEFNVLPLNKIKPEGWIKHQMERDLESGFTGHLNELTSYADFGITGDGQIKGVKINEKGEKEYIDKSWWPGETTPVWMDGYVRSAFLTGDSIAVQTSRQYVEDLLLHQYSEGYIGIYQPGIRYNHTTENAELWSQSRLYRVMLDYYEFTGDQKVLDAVEKAVALTMKMYPPGYDYFVVNNPYGGVSHGLMFLDIMEWLYRITGDEKYVSHGEYLYDVYSHFDNPRLNDTRLNDLLNPDRPIMGHTPHVAEQLRVPIWLYYATGKPIYRKAYEMGYKKMTKYMVPSGAVHSGFGEDIKGLLPEPHMPYEYCGITELLDTQESLFGKTGQTSYADQAELLFMNAGQGARLSNGKGVTYFSRDNRIKATPEGSRGRFKFSPTHEEIAVCCNPNASKLTPYYVQAMWMQKNQEIPALASVFFGPSVLETEIANVPVSIKQETMYPFSDSITYTVVPEKGVDFEIWIRIPGWSKKMEIHVSNAEIRSENGFYIITKKWRKRDKIEVILHPEILSIESVNGELALQRGALLYALPLPNKREILKEYPVKGFADYSFTASDTTLWNLHLNPDGFKEFKFHTNYTTIDLDYPWDNSPVYLTGSLDDMEGNEKSVKLVPMGTTILRRLTFPME